MRQVIIHAGFHKTATSSIQATCANNLSKLEESGLYYPIFYLNGRSIINHSDVFYSLFTSNPEQYHVNVSLQLDVNEANQKYEQQINEMLQKKRNKIVISGEDISLLTKLEFNRMTAKIRSYGYDIRVIIFVRSPLSFLNSIIQQRVKCGETMENMRVQSTKNKIEEIISIFPETEFYSFQESCKHNHGLIGYFLNLIGVKKISEIELVNSNESLSNQSARLISYINGKQPFWINKKINPLRSQGDTNIFRKIKGEKFKLTSHELEKFKHVLDQDNKYLLEKFGVDFCDSKPYLTSEEEIHNHWSDEQLKHLKIAISKIDKDGISKEIISDYFKNVVKLDNQKIYNILSTKIPNNKFLKICKSKNLVDQKSDYINGFHIDKPKLEEEYNLEKFLISGWVLGKQQPVVAVEVFINKKLIEQVPVKLHRQDVSDTKGDLAKVQGSNNGFSIVLNLNELSLPNKGRIVFKAVFANGDKERLKVVQIITK